MGVLLAGLASALLLATFAWLAVDGLWRPDAFDYAQIARELSQGHGFSTRQAIYALHLEFLKRHELLAGDWPNLHRFPLPSLAMALGFRLFGAADAVVVGYGIVFHAATAALLFAWARALSGAWAALACVLLVSLNGTLLELACSGLSEPPVLFFFTAALYAVWRQARGDSLLLSAAAGAALGLAGLARTSALFAAPWFALALWLGSGAGAPNARARRALGQVCAFAAALTLVSLPWWWRNLGVAGDPFFSLHSYFLLPSGTQDALDKWDLSVPWVRELTSPLAVLREQPGAVLAKWGTNFARWLASLGSFGGLFAVVPLAALSACLPLREGMRRVAWLLFACFLWNALLASFTDFFLLKYHLHFAPGLILLAVAGVWQLAARLPDARLRATACALVTLVMANPGGTLEALDEVKAQRSRYDPRHWPEIRRLTSDDALIVSDQSHAVTWETGRRSVRLHYDRTPEGQLVLGVSALERLYLQVDAVYLSRQFLRDPGRQDALRRTLARDAEFRRAFPHAQTLEGGGLLFLRGAGAP